MYNKISFKIEGQTPYIQHNGRTKDPQDPFSVALKKITSKRNKTDDDFVKIKELEFQAGLYLDEDGRVICPGENLEKMFKEAAKKFRLGRAVDQALFVDQDPLLLYEGPKDAKKLYQQKKFQFYKPVNIKGNSVMRMRPIFHVWALEFEVKFMADFLDRDQIIDILKYAGIAIGFSSYRPRYGRFYITHIDGKAIKREDIYGKAFAA